MRIFGFLGLIIVIAIVAMQYKNNIRSTDSGEAESLSQSVEDEVNQSVSDIQKKLDDALKQSGAE